MGNRLLKEGRKRCSCDVIVRGTSADSQEMDCAHCGCMHHSFGRLGHLTLPYAHQEIIHCASRNSSHDILHEDKYGYHYIHQGRGLIFLDTVDCYKGVAQRTGHFYKVLSLCDELGRNIYAAHRDSGWQQYNYAACYDSYQYVCVHSIDPGDLPLWHTYGRY